MPVAGKASLSKRYRCPKHVSVDYQIEIPSTKPAQKVALLVGIDRYQSGIGPLSNAVRDVRAVADVLKKQHGYEVHLIEDDQATPESVTARLRELSSKLSAETRFLFYFAGHGVAEDLFERMEQSSRYFGGPIEVQKYQAKSPYMETSRLLNELKKELSYVENSGLNDISRELYRLQQQVMVG